MGSQGKGLSPPVWSPPRSQKACLRHRSFSSASWYLCLRTRGYRFNACCQKATECVALLMFLCSNPASHLEGRKINFSILVGAQNQAHWMLKFSASDTAVLIQMRMSTQSLETSFLGNLIFSVQLGKDKDRMRTEVSLYTFFRKDVIMKKVFGLQRRNLEFLIDDWSGWVLHIRVCVYGLYNEGQIGSPASSQLEICVWLRKGDVFPSLPLSGVLPYITVMDQDLI